MTRLTEIEAQIKALQTEADLIKKEAFDTALAEVKKAISTHGFTAKDLGFGVEKSPKETGAVPAKYKKGDQV